MDEGNTSIVRNVSDKMPRFAEGKLRLMELSWHCFLNYSCQLTFLANGTELVCL